MKKKPDLIQVLEAYAVEIPPRYYDDTFNTLCPFHHESTPSFSVDVGQGLWFCFHDSIGGDVYDFVGAMEFDLRSWDNRDKTQFKRVLEILKERNFTPREVEPKPKKRRQLSQDVLFLLQHVTEIYHQNLLQSPQAMRYLLDRGLTEAYIRKRKIASPREICR